MRDLARMKARFSTLSLSGRNKVSPEPGDGNSEIYTIYNNSLEEVRDIEREEVLNSDNIKTEKERGWC